MKKLLFILSLITSFLVISSCSNANKSNSISTNSLIDYKDIYVEIDSKTQKDIEQAWLKKYNKEIIWCMPIEMNEFKTIDDLNKYIRSHNGIRIYGVFDGAYVLCKYYTIDDVSKEYAFLDVFYSLQYDNVDESLINNNEIWGTTYNSTYIYKDGNITALEENVYNIDDYIPITYEEALTIKEKNDKYIEKYFKKFMTEEDKSVNSAYSRIRNSLIQKQPNTTQTTKPNTTLK